MCSSAQSQPLQRLSTISAVATLAVTGVAGATALPGGNWNACYVGGEFGAVRAFDCHPQGIGRGPGEADAGTIETIRLDPNDFRPGHSGSSDPAKSDLERVIAHYSDTITLDPNDDDAYFRRGIANLYAGSPTKALADVSRASELDPMYPYYALWLDMIDKRSSRPSRLAQALAHIDMMKWPAPIVLLFLGQTTPRALLAAAAAPDAQTQRGQVCEANFYIGQLALQQGTMQEAAHRFRLAAADCPRDFVEGPAASAELAVLDIVQ